MRHCLSFLFAVIYILPASGQEPTFRYPLITSTAATIKDFTPDGWHIKDTAFGDLNKDNIPDAVIVLEYKEKANIIKRFTDSAPDTIGDIPRMLIVVFGKMNGYQLACQSNRAIMSSSEGGMMGDPYEGVAINNGCLNISYFGGSADKWGLHYRFRYQNSAFYLIGATNTGTYFAKTNIFDYNLLTGVIQITRTDDEQPKTNRKYKKTYKRTSLPLLDSFEPWTMQVDEKEDISF